MTKNRSLLTLSVFALLVASSPVLAAAARTFVSGIGDDVGSCPVTAPCRTFAFALTQTAPSGEIIVLGSAGYGTLTINQAVSIINVGFVAGVTVANGADGITINAGINDAVVLRGLTVDGGGTGANGIVFNSGSALTIDQCNVMNFAGGSTIGVGIAIQPAAGNHTVAITNTTADHNQFIGVLYGAIGSTATTTLVLDHVSAKNNGIGVDINNAVSAAGGAVTASISNTIASGNGTGFLFKNATVSLDSSYATNNGMEGVDLSGGTLTVGRSVIAYNLSTGLHNNGATVNSYGDNRIIGNNNPQTVGTITPVSPQ
jgi:hypothetical protein